MALLVKTSKFTSAALTLSGTMSMQQLCTRSRCSFCYSARSISFLLRTALSESSESQRHLVPILHLH
jgi:hypothetical protein